MARLSLCELTRANEANLQQKGRQHIQLQSSRRLMSKFSSLHFNITQTPYINIDGTAIELAVMPHDETLAKVFLQRTVDKPKLSDNNNTTLPHMLVIGTANWLYQEFQINKQTAKPEEYQLVSDSMQAVHFAIPRRKQSQRVLSTFHIMDEYAIFTETDVQQLYCLFKELNQNNIALTIVDTRGGKGMAAVIALAYMIYKDQNVFCDDDASSWEHIQEKFAALRANQSDAIKSYRQLFLALQLAKDIIVLDGMEQVSDLQNITARDHATSKQATFASHLSRARQGDAKGANNLGVELIEGSSKNLDAARNWFALAVLYTKPWQEAEKNQALKNLIRTMTDDKGTLSITHAAATVATSSTSREDQTDSVEILTRFCNQARENKNPLLLIKIATVLMAVFKEELHLNLKGTHTLEDAIHYFKLAIEASEEHPFVINKVSIALRDLFDLDGLDLSKHADKSSYRINCRNKTLEFFTNQKDAGQRLIDTIQEQFVTFSHLNERSFKLDDLSENLAVVANDIKELTTTQQQYHRDIFSYKSEHELLLQQLSFKKQFIALQKETGSALARLVIATIQKGMPNQLQELLDKNPDAPIRHYFDYQRSLIEMNSPNASIVEKLLEILHSHINTLFDMLARDGLRFDRLNNIPKHRFTDYLRQINMVLIQFNNFKENMIIVHKEHEQQAHQPVAIPTLNRGVVESIFAKLDTPTLLAAGCSNREWHAIANTENLWEQRLAATVTPHSTSAATSSDDNTAVVAVSSPLQLRQQSAKRRYLSRFIFTPAENRDACEYLTKNPEELIRLIDNKITGSQLPRNYSISLIKPTSTTVPVVAASFDPYLLKVDKITHFDEDTLICTHEVAVPKLKLYAACSNLFKLNKKLINNNLDDHFLTHVEMALANDILDLNLAYGETIGHVNQRTDRDMLRRLSSICGNLQLNNQQFKYPHITTLNQRLIDFLVEQVKQLTDITEYTNCFDRLAIHTLQALYSIFKSSDEIIGATKSSLLGYFCDAICRKLVALQVDSLSTDEQNMLKHLHFGVLLDNDRLGTREAAKKAYVAILFSDHLQLYQLIDILKYQSAEDLEKLFLYMYQDIHDGHLSRWRMISDIRTFISQPHEDWGADKQDKFADYIMQYSESSTRFLTYKNLRSLLTSFRSLISFHQSLITIDNERGFRDLLHMIFHRQATFLLENFHFEDPEQYQQLKALQYTSLINDNIQPYRVEQRAARSAYRNLLFKLQTKHQFELLEQQSSESLTALNKSLHRYVDTDFIHTHVPDVINMINAILLRRTFLPEGVAADAQPETSTNKLFKEIPFDAFYQLYQNDADAIRDYYNCFLDLDPTEQFRWLLTKLTELNQEFVARELDNHLRRDPSKQAEIKDLFDLVLKPHKAYSSENKALLFTILIGIDNKICINFLLKLAGNENPLQRLSQLHEDFQEVNKSRSLSFSAYYFAIGELFNELPRFDSAQRAQQLKGFKFTSLCASQSSQAKELFITYMRSLISLENNHIPDVVKHMDLGSLAAIADQLSIPMSRINQIRIPANIRQLIYSIADERLQAQLSLEPTAATATASADDAAECAASSSDRVPGARLLLGQMAPHPSFFSLAREDDSSDDEVHYADLNDFAPPDSP